MKRLHSPTPRRRSWLLRAWTAPTTWLGGALATALGCSPPQRVGGAASSAVLRLLPPGKLRGLGALAYGHTIIAESEFLEGLRGVWVLAHELSHTRQHDWLGPVYLPLHGACQGLSCLVALLRPIRGYPPQHAYNPLERAFLAVPFDALVGELPEGAEADRVLAGFGLGPDDLR
jgi:hypothetical protein